uniref:Germin-like protein n=1 Tax=Salix viminalis TaxID=40686 RepID=A0A6N2KGG9_SALVM
MEGIKFVLVFVLLALASSLTFASDPSPLQDFYVAINETDGVFVNGKFCKDPKLVSEKDFFFPGLNIPETLQSVGSTVTRSTLFKFQDSTLLHISVGLIHFQLNVGKAKAVAFAGLSSQNPGVITIGNAVFGSEPPINPDVLTKAFQVDKIVVNFLQKQFWWDNN